MDHCSLVLLIKLQDLVCGSSDRRDTSYRIVTRKAINPLENHCIVRRLIAEWLY